MVPSFCLDKCFYCFVFVSILRYIIIEIDRDSFFVNMCLLDEILDEVDRIFKDND